MPDNSHKPSIKQTAIGNGNIQIIGSRNTITQRIIKLVQGDNEQQQAQRNRSTMLKRIKKTWINEVLEKSVNAGGLIKLGLGERSGAVERSWDTQVQMPMQIDRILPSGTSIIQVFDEMNGALLILGEAGAGKTTMLLELARDTISRAEQNPSLHIPVVLNLSSWSNPKQSIASWIINELTVKYYISKSVAQIWVEHDDLLLLLDGLDEVMHNCRVACVNAINDFRSEHGMMPMVVCSRIADYEILSTRLKLQGSVLLQPLTLQQIDDYFKFAGTEMTIVRTVLQRDTILQELIKVPLMLNILMLACQGVNEEMFVNEQPTSTEIWRKRLFEVFIQRMFERVARTKNEQYPPNKSKQWLSWLSRQMIQRERADFFISDLRPSWLPLGTHWKHYLVIMNIISLFFAVTIPMSLIIGLLTKLLIGSHHFLQGILIGGVSVGIINIVLGWILEDPDMESTFARSSVLEDTGDLGGTAVSAVPVMLKFMRSLILSSFLGFTFDTILFVPLTIVLGVLSGGIGIFFVWLLNSLNLTIEVSLFVGLKLGSLMGVSLGIELWLLFALFYVPSHWQATTIGHFVARMALAHNGIFPWNVKRFLDYSVDRIFLRKIDKGYIFIHRLLLEYFASLDFTLSDN